MILNKSKCLGSLAIMGALFGGSAMGLEKVTFGTNWLAQAEHGGFYQAVADGTYEACGIDVSIVTGGPQVNNKALLLAGKLQFHMGGDMLQAFSSVEQDIPVVVVAAAFQKHPQVILSHPESASSWEELKDLTLLIGDNGFQSYYQWMVKQYGFTIEQREPYTYSTAPFLADKNKGMQGFLTSEPYAIEKEGGFVPNVFLIADAGYSSYATTIETMADTINNKPEVVECFVDGSNLGWANYLYGDNAAANELIKADNPGMSDDKLAYAISKMKEHGIVVSGEAETLGIGAMTDEKIKDFFDKMVTAGVISADVNYKDSYTLDFVNKGVGVDIVGM